LIPVAIAIMTGIIGCAALPNTTSLVEMHTRVDDMQAAVVAIDTEVEDVTLELAAVKTTIGHQNIGGGGDSITAWIYALIAGAAVLYPVVIRPIRMAYFASRSYSTESYSTQNKHFEENKNVEEKR
jgi:hypothetical protein